MLTVELLHLLPTGSEEREVLGVGSIPVAILPSCHDMKTIAILLHKHEYNWVVKIRNNLGGSIQATILPLAIILTAALWALVSMIA